MSVLDTESSTNMGLHDPDLIPREGDLSVISPAELLRRALLGRVTGTLIIRERSRPLRHVNFDAGLPVSAYGDEGRESILEHLRRNRQLSKRRLRELEGADQAAALTELLSSGEVNPAAASGALRNVGQRVLQGIFATTDAPFSFMFGQADGAHQRWRSLDAFRAHVDYLRECVPAEQTVRRIAESRGKVLGLSVAGLANRSLLRGVFELSPSLERALDERWSVSQLLSHAGAALDMSAQVLSSLVVLGAVDLNDAQGEGGGPGLARIFRGASSRSTPGRSGPRERRATSSDAEATARLLHVDGLTYLSLGDLVEAQDHFRRASGLCPGDATFLAYFGWSTFLRGTSDGSNDAQWGRNAIVEAVALAPESDVVHTVLGNLYMKTEEVSLAMAAFKRALEINPTNDEARSQLLTLELGV